jgi:hypothetical protein
MGVPNQWVPNHIARRENHEFRAWRSPLKNEASSPRRHRDRAATLAACAEAVIETLRRRDDERSIAARFADGTRASQLGPALRELDAEHFDRPLDADALLQFAKVDRVGHGVLLSLPEAIV